MTSRVFLVSIVLTLLLAISNTYLALKIGFVTAASIPAAILSMGILKFSKKATMFEHNLVQTAASSGEAIAGGIAYTIPALIIIGFWSNFNYWESVLLALTGGVIGVLFSAIIRRPLLKDPTLKFPEGQAIAEVLKLKQHNKIGVLPLLFGGLLGAIVDFCQSTQLMFAQTSRVIFSNGSLYSFGVGFAPALIGAGYIIGLRIGLSLLLGIVISYGIVLPVISHGSVLNEPASTYFGDHFAMAMRYVGVGGMIMAAIITLIRLLKPIYQNITKTFSEVRSGPLVEHERDLSIKSIVFGTLISVVVLGIVFNHLFGLADLGFSTGLNVSTLLLSLAYVMVIGFVITMICGYFSGLVGVSASPGSSVMIAGMILAALLIHGLFLLHTPDLSSHMLLIGEAVTILISSAVMQIACISNDTLQDLKVGQIIGASPRQQQWMLIFGVVIASLVVPAVMQLLYLAYGIAGHMPHAGMDPARTLASPPSAIMAMLTQVIFEKNIPWHELGIGALSVLVVYVLSLFTRKKAFEISLLGVGIGMYLSLTISTPLVIGGIISGVVFWLNGKNTQDIRQHRNILIACGLVTGGALMDIVLTIPMVIHADGAGLSFDVPVIVSVGLGVVALIVALGMFLRNSR
jgi:putative OPT family oligopeptide transporter